MRTYRQGGIPAQVRTAADFAALAFAGLEMIEPGVVLVSDWRRHLGAWACPRRSTGTAVSAASNRT